MNKKKFPEGFFTKDRPIAKPKYVNVELLKDQFEKHCEQVGESVDDWGMFYEEFPRMLADITSADVHPVVHAHWVRIDGTGYCKCSNCGKHPKVIGTIQYSEFKFCPNCGSKMNG